MATAGLHHHPAPWRRSDLYLPYEGFQDSVSKTHLMLFPKQARYGARSTETRWTSRLPNMKDLEPGYHFDLKGMMKSGKDDGVPYRSEGEVVSTEEIMVGTCSYSALVIQMNSYLRDELIIRSTNYLSPDLGVLLRSDFIPTSAGDEIDLCGGCGRLNLPRRVAGAVQRAMVSSRTNMLAQARSIRSGVIW